MLTFFGTLELSGPEPTAGPTTPRRNTSIVLQNLTYGFDEACVMDIKLGAQLCDDGAPPEKRDRLGAVSNATTSRSLGLHILLLLLTLLLPPPQRPTALKTATLIFLLASSNTS